MPEPRRFQTLAALDEYWNLMLARVELEPAPVVRSAKRLEVVLKRDDALRALAREVEERAEAERDALTPRPPPRPEPEPLPADATDDERAQRLYGDRLPIQREVAAKPTEAIADQPYNEEAANALYGNPVMVGGGSHRNPYALREQPDPPTPGDEAP